MRIVKLVLHRYTRFALAQIETIVYTPEKRIQTIIGTNGSGKSSLVDQLTPLPADPRDFDTGGYKEISIEHQDSYFVMRNDTRYSFKKDDVELNNSGNKTFQIELVKTHFNITPRLHALFTDKLLFTRMTPGQRKEWLTQISGIDFDYAFRVFERVKREQRDTQANVKLITSKLSELKPLLLTAEQLAQYIKDKELLEEFIGLLHTRIKNDKTPAFDGYRSLTELLAIVENGVGDEDELKTMLAGLEKEKVKLETESTNLIKQFEVSKEYEEMTEGDVGELTKQSDALKNEIKNLEAVETFTLENYDNLLYYIERILPSLGELAENIDNVQSKVKDLKRSDVVNKQVKADKDFNRLNDEITIHRNKLKELTETQYNKDVVCPVCSAKFTPEHDKDEESKLKNKLEKLGTHVTALTADLEKLEKTIGMIDELVILKQKFVAYFKHSDETSDLLYYLYRHYTVGLNVVHDADSFVTMYNLLTAELLRMKTRNGIGNLTKRLQRIEDKLTFINDRSKIDIPKSKDIETELSNLTRQQSVNEKSFVETVDKLKAIEKHRSAVDTITTLLQKVNAERKRRVYSVRDEYLLKAIHDLKTEVSRIQALISSDGYNAKLAAGYQKDIDEMLLHSDRLKKLTKSLDPKEGVIANTITAFLGNFFTNMNNVIRLIWTYDLEILPRREDATVIDYNFPVRIPRGGSKDISETSTSMKEIIDIGFRIMVMKYLGITDYPLFLDEFAASFDEVHRVNAFSAIERLLGDDNQIFIISHYYSNHGGMINSDLVILSDMNLYNVASGNKSNIVDIKGYA